MSAATEPADDKQEEVTRWLHDAQMKYTRTCQALFSILQHMDAALAIDADQQQIVDRSKLRNNVVVGANISAPFFEWLAANKNLG